MTLPLRTLFHKTGSPVQPGNRQQIRPWSVGEGGPGGEGDERDEWNAPLQALPWEMQPCSNKHMEGGDCREERGRGECKSAAEAALGVCARQTVAPAFTKPSAALTCGLSSCKDLSAPTGAVESLGRADKCN